MKHFLKGRLDIAKALSSDIPGATYADVVLIITAVLSACASLRWPGRGIDKKRFIELLVRHSPEEFHTSWVSIPPLINQGFISEEETLYRNGNFNRVFCGEEIDLPIKEASVQYPNVTSKQLRQHCYSSLIYEWLRCGYAHEYCPHENISHVPASRKDARVSYIRRLTPENREIERRQFKRMQGKRKVSFHLDYLMSIAEYHVSILASKKSLPPTTWWIEEPSGKENDTMNHEKQTVKKLFDRLCQQEKQPFPKKRQPVDAPLKKGVYILRKNKTILYVGRTLRAKKGIRQRLTDHLRGSSSFTKNYLHGNGATLREKGHTYQYLELDDPRKRALLEHYAIGALCPSHLGTGEPKKP